MENQKHINKGPFLIAVISFLLLIGRTVLRKKFKAEIK